MEGDGVVIGAGDDVWVDSPVLYVNEGAVADDSEVVDGRARCAMSYGVECRFVSGVTDDQVFGRGEVND